MSNQEEIKILAAKVRRGRRINLFAIPIFVLLWAIAHAFVIWSHHQRALQHITALDTSPLPKTADPEAIRLRAIQDFIPVVWAYNSYTFYFMMAFVVPIILLIVFLMSIRTEKLLLKIADRIAEQEKA